MYLLLHYREEFTLVYTGIYSEDIEQKQKAMEKMMTWQSRYMDIDNVPLPDDDMCSH